MPTESDRPLINGPLHPGYNTVAVALYAGQSPNSIPTTLTGPDSLRRDNGNSRCDRLETGSCGLQKAGTNSRSGKRVRAVSSAFLVRKLSIWQPHSEQYSQELTGLFQSTRAPWLRSSILFTTERNRFVARILGLQHNRMVIVP